MATRSKQPKISRLIIILKNMTYLTDEYRSTLLNQDEPVTEGGEETTEGGEETTETTEGGEETTEGGEEM